jgi:hypothetical protein
MKMIDAPIIVALVASLASLVAGLWKRYKERFLLNKSKKRYEVFILDGDGNPVRSANVSAGQAEHIANELSRYAPEKSESAAPRVVAH